MSTTLIIGASRGLGLELARQALAAGERGWRDTLVITLRSHGFQGP